HAHLAHSAEEAGREEIKIVSPAKLSGRNDEPCGLHRKNFRRRARRASFGRSLGYSMPEALRA
ncbi:MAG: hypothetical protein ACRENG_23865, partial [bacterium]